MAQEDYEVVITYQPLADEVVPEKYFHTDATHVYAVPHYAHTDPVIEAEKVSVDFADKKVVVLIPGQAFDAAGTRHGRGGGWYDRFLATIPPQWYRIGFCFADQFSSESLVREKWDQPVDAVIAVNRESDESTYHETHARDLY